jgi:hypothetical protein
VTFPKEIEGRSSWLLETYGGSRWKIDGGINIELSKAFWIKVGTDVMLDLSANEAESKSVANMRKSAGARVIEQC